MKRLISVVLAFALMISLASCSGRGKDRSLLYAIPASPKTLDPQYTSETGAKIIINNIFEGLVRFDMQGNIIPGIAESWQISQDGLTYTFRLKEGTEWFCPSGIKSEFGEELYNRFSTEKVTAHDFAFAFKRAVMPATMSASAHRFSVIENAPDIIAGIESPEKLGVTAVDDFTLTIRLSEKCDDFLQRLTESAFMPCNEDFFKATGGRYGLSNRYILCNGPFYVSSWDSSSSLTIKKNTYYAGGQEVLPASVVFTFDPSKESVAKKVSAGSVSAAVIPYNCDLPENATVAKESADTVFGFVFNCSDASLSNESLRKALSMTVDTSFFEDIDENTDIVKGIIPGSCKVGAYNYREAVGVQTKQLAFNKGNAVRHWEQALTELETSKIQLTVLTPDWLETPVRRQLQLWQQNFGIDLGITVEVADSAKIESAVASGDFQIALTGMGTAGDSAVDFLESLSGGKIFRYYSDEFDFQVGSLKTHGNQDSLLEACYKAESLLLGKAVCYPLYSRSSCFVLAEDVEGVMIIDSESTVSFIGAKRYD